VHFLSGAEATMRKSLLILSSLLGVASVTACTTSHVDEADAGIVIPDSAHLPDTTAPDAFVEPGAIGTPCAVDTDCSAPATTCVEDPQLLPNGYCTAICDEADPTTCPDGSHCVNVGGGMAICFQDCDPSVTDTRQCERPGYGCSTSFMFSGVCVGGCFDGTDCMTGQDCDPAGGGVGAGACFAPGAAVGDPCTDDSTCPMGGFCQTEVGTGWPAGSCLVTGCDPVANTGCAGDAQCVTSTSPFGSTDFCIDGCATTADCRDGYVCRGSASNPDRLGCYAGCTADAQCSGGRVCNAGLGTCDDPFDAGDLGTTCSGRDPTTCVGGTCLSERVYGFPMSYCAYFGCSATEPCPGSGVCAPSATGAGVCLDACASTSDCRLGYACAPSDPTMPTSATACVPGCTADTDCSNATRGFVCNPGTGLCGLPFMGTPGEPCATAAECDGGVCFTEADSGWPAGTCTYPGCRLAGTGGTAVCPGGSACVDDGAGSPDLGVCVDACDVGTTSCRPGYACVAVEGSTTVGACRPACEAASCSGGRTCSATTGLCE
jgi:hypothetical protein